MAKTRTAYQCSACKATTSKWVGKCPQCHEWGTINEAAPTETMGAGLKSNFAAATVTRPALRVSDIKVDRARHTTTGLGELDRVLGGGFVAGGVILLAGEPGAGKALALNTPIPTPSGWTTMGEIGVGDHVLGPDGKPTRVLAATDIMTGRVCHQVTFSDGSVIVADAEHQWLTESRSERMRGRAPKVRTTAEIASTIRYGKEGRTNHSVRVAEALDLPDADLPIPAYTMGAWLGDGTSKAAAITCNDQEILWEIEAEGVLTAPLRAEMRHSLLLPRPETQVPQETGCPVCGTRFVPKSFRVLTCGNGRCVWEAGRLGLAVPVRRCSMCDETLSADVVRSKGRCYRCAMGDTFTGRLKALGVWGNKHIPTRYLRGSIEQRRALLAGLLDTDGWVEHGGGVVLELTNRRLALDAFELIATLGYKPTWNDNKRVKGRTEATSTVCRVGFTTEDKVFRLTRKNASRVRPTSPTASARYIQSAEEVQSVPVRCIQVANADRMYLAGRAMIPTHNSTLLTEVAHHAAETGRTVLYCSGEESQEQIKLRADRIGATSENLFIASETNLSVVLGHIDEVQPDLLILDSVQTVASPDIEGRIGGVTQVIEVASVLSRVAKQRGIPTVLVGQMTKNDEIGGPRALEHLVDCVAVLEGDKRSTLRLLRGIKNRYGPADEIGCFVHTSTGLEEVSDPSGLFMGSRQEPVAGTCVTVVVEGKRPLMAEVQSLVAGSHLPVPRRGSSGLDNARLTMTQAVVERHGGVRLYDKDVYCATVGGMRIAEPSADLAVALAIVSASQEAPLNPDLVVLGEVALSGDVRPVHDIERRLAEARRMGFGKAMVPTGTMDRLLASSAQEQRSAMGGKKVNGVVLIEVDSVGMAVRALGSMQ